MTAERTAVATIGPAAAPAIVPEVWTAEQIALLKRTVCKGATDDEFALFAYVAKRRRLDPFARQLYAIKRREKDGNTWRDVMTFQTAIDGFRVVAARTGEMDGQDGPFWCGPDGAWCDAWLSKEPPVSAKVVVYRKGHTRPYTGIARYEAYVQTKADGNPNQMWDRMADGQLAKCAEALALRKAFPEDLGGLYTDEEMGQADNPKPEPRRKIKEPQARPETPAIEHQPPAQGGADQAAAITEKERRQLFGAGREAGHVDDDVRQYLKDRYDVVSSKAVPKVHFQGALKRMHNAQPLYVAVEGIMLPHDPYEPSYCRVLPKEEPPADREPGDDDVPPAVE